MRRVTLAALGVLAAAPAMAHHGWSTYDAANLLVLSAPILEATYAYPHGEVVIEAEGKRWHVVLAPPSRMERRGLAAADLTVGKSITVEGYPSTVHDGEMRAERVTLDGRTIEMR